MKREFLKELGLEDDVIQKIMDENGKDITREQAKTTAANESADTLRTQLGEANAKIESFKDIDPAALKQEVEDWKKKAEKAETEAAEKVAALEFDGVLKDKLNGLKFSSEYAKKGVVDEIKAKGLKLEKGAILGFDDALKAIQEANPDAFIKEGEKPPAMWAGTGNAKIPTEKPDISKMGYKERVELYKQSPEQYKNLTGKEE